MPGAFPPCWRPSRSRAPIAACSFFTAGAIASEPPRSTATFCGASPRPRTPRCFSSIIASRPSIRSRRRSTMRSRSIAGSSLASTGAASALSPWTDLALTGASMRANAEADPMLDPDNLPDLVRNYCAGADPRHPYISPIYGDPTGLPPALIHVGSDEILRDDAVGMAEKMRAAGCAAEVEIWEKMPHVWHLYARLIPEGRRAIARIGQFLQERM